MRALRRIESLQEMLQNMASDIKRIRIGFQGDTARGVIEPLTEPVSIAKAMLAGEQAHVIESSNGRAKSVFLVNIQLTSWGYEEQSEYEKGYAEGFNRAAKLMQEALIEKMDKPIQRDLSDAEILEKASASYFSSQNASMYIFSPQGFISCVREILENK